MKNDRFPKRLKILDTSFIYNNTNQIKNIKIVSSFLNSVFQDIKICESLFFGFTYPLKKNFFPPKKNGSYL